MTEADAKEPIPLCAFLTWHRGILGILEVPNGTGGRSRVVVQLCKPGQAAELEQALADPAAGVIGPAGEVRFTTPAAEVGHPPRIELLRAVPTSDGSMVWGPLIAASHGSNWLIGAIGALFIILLTGSRIKNHGMPAGFWGKSTMVAKWFLFWNPGDFRSFTPAPKPTAKDKPNG